MVFRRIVGKLATPKASEVRRVAQEAEQAPQAPPPGQDAEIETTAQVSESASAGIPSMAVDQDQAVAELGAELGIDPTQGGSGTTGGVAGAAAASVPGATSFITSATQGLSGSVLENFMGRNGPDQVDLLTDMDQNPAPRFGEVTKDQLRERAYAALNFDDSAQNQSILGSSSIAHGESGDSWAWRTAKAIADRGSGSGATNPQARFDDEGLHMRGTGEWAKDQHPAFHAVAKLISSNLERGQAEIDTAEGAGAGGAAGGSGAPAGPVVEVRNGNLHSTHADGSRSTTFADGTEVTKLKDGTVIIRRTDRSSTTQSPDGTITDTDSKGNSESITPGADYQLEPDYSEVVSLIPHPALEAQLAAKRAAGSGDVDPAPDHEDLNFGAGDPGGDEETRRRIRLDGDPIDDEYQPGTRGGPPNLGNTNFGAIDWGPDAVTSGGTGPDQDRVGDTLLGDRPTLGIDDAHGTSSDGSDDDEADDTDGT